MTRYALLAQAAPTSGQYTLLYSPPVNAILSNLKVCNTNIINASGEFRILIVTGSVTGNTEQFLYNVGIPSRESFSISEGWTIASGQKLVVYNTITGISYNIFGKEF